MLIEKEFPNRAAKRDFDRSSKRNGHAPKITKLHKSLFDKVGQSILRHPEWWDGQKVSHLAATRLKDQVTWKKNRA